MQYMIDGYGSFLAASMGAGLDLWEVSEPLAPVLVGHYHAVGATRDVTIDDGWAYVIDMQAETVEIIDLRGTFFLNRYTSGSPGATLNYDVYWNEPVDADVVCEVSHGTVGVDDVDSVTGTADVAWELPDAELVCGVGNSATYTILRDRVSVQ